MLRDNLIMLRRLNGFSQEQIAERINISRQAYAKWESGLTVPDVDKAALLASVYGVSLDSLMKTEAPAGVGVLPPAPLGKNIWGTVTIGERGQIVIPKRAREIFDIKPGDQLLMLGDEEQGLALVKNEIFLQFANAIFEMQKKPEDTEE
jgi:AbrB family looped-hinge helix DNA binding protein